MSHKICTVESFTMIAPHVLKGDFSDRTSRQIDLRPVLVGEICGPLSDLNLFERFVLALEVQTLAGPNGADFDPATSHDCPGNVEEVARAVVDWNSTDAMLLRDSPK